MFEKYSLKIVKYGKQKFDEEYNTNIRFMFRTQNIEEKHKYAKLFDENQLFCGHFYQKFNFSKNVLGQKHY